jgi:hypothetical protein
VPFEEQENGSGDRPQNSLLQMVGARDTRRFGLTSIWRRSIPVRDKTERDFLYRDISHRSFKRQFSLAGYVQVKSAAFDNGLLTIELVREIPEAMKPAGFRSAMPRPATCRSWKLRLPPSARASEPHDLSRGSIHSSRKGQNHAADDRWRQCFRLQRSSSSRYGV